MTQASAASRLRALARQLRDVAMILAAGFPLLVLIAFAVGLVGALNRAHASDAGSCGGISLATTMAAENPGAYAAAVAEADAVPNGHGRLWKVEKAGLAPSWLFGTMHVTDPRVVEMPPAARSAFDGAGTLVIETTDILDPAKAQAALLTQPELTMFTDGTTLESLLKGDDLKLVEDELKRRGIPLALVSRLKPWMVAGLVALSDCEMTRRSSGEDFLDKKIADEAAEDGKQLLGLETMGEQLSAMASLPVEFHVRGLVETIKLADLMPDVSATMTDLYLAGEISLIMPLVRAASPEGDDDDSAGYAAFEERIVRVRNHVMAERAAPILDKGSAFIAVGALHLPGEEGLVSLLQNAGYQVTRAL
ncbi:hypothetical protein DFR52_105318 [Hoeflea marina]|uniref:Polysaccharide biosynthesis protein GumN n=1 Tax=Hoeflea marina TaxID=274592 RepID=A0A317PEK9_9HYPH|nr:TraB/GumN family protein [Hoeflea marina]PWV98335.1 hypothetical protein DFR52_105318 [Hoeflea marina]